MEEGKNMTEEREEVLKLPMRVERSEDSAKMLAIGDSHIGNRYHDKLMYNRFMDWIYKNKDYQIITMGDLIECANKSSVGLMDQVMTVDDQIDQIVEDFGPIADEGRMIGMLIGNHEKRALKQAGIDVTHRISRELKVRDLGVGALLYLQVKKDDAKRGQNYVVYAKHGTSGASSVGGKLNAVYRMRDVVYADLYLHAHVHTLDQHKREIYRIDRGNLVSDKQHFVLTGSYLTYWGSYGEEKGYPPSGTSGSPKIKFHANMNRISVSL